MNTSNDYRDVSYPDGRVIRENHDLRGRADTIVDRGAGGSGTPVTLADNAYDLNNRQTSRVFANGVLGNWTYDDAGRVSSVSHVLIGSPPTTIASVNYGRDDVGNPMWREDVQEASHSELYRYDDSNRLFNFLRGTLNTGKTDVTYTTDSNLTQRNAWTLDKLGNWDSFLKRTNDTTITEPRTNNKANEYLTIDPDGSGGASPLTLAHDQNGNLTDDGTYLYEYDIENRMTRVKLKSGSVTLADYHYDALGRRIRKIIPTGQPGAGTWTYVVNELWQVMSEYHTVSSTTTHIRRYAHAGRSAYVDDHVVMWELLGGKHYFYHADAQFCTVAMTDHNAAVEERYVTDPYGKAVTYTSAWGTPQATSRLGNPFMHQGLWLDGECGKYQNRRREYLPTLGGFAQRDPLGYFDSENLTLALKNNPTYYLDPRGEFATLSGCFQYCVSFFAYCLSCTATDGISGGSPCVRNLGVCLNNCANPPAPTNPPTPPTFSPRNPISLSDCTGTPPVQGQPPPPNQPRWSEIVIGAIGTQVPWSEAWGALDAGAQIARITPCNELRKWVINNGGAEDWSNPEFVRLFTLCARSGLGG